jgi:cell wall assembly regulator SMI1
MREVWKRLEVFAKRSGKSLRLRPGAKEAAIRAAEKTIGIPFPDAFRESLLLHDGQEPGDDDCFEWLPGHPRLASLERILEQWKHDCANFEKFHATEDAHGVDGDRCQHYLWHPKRIPIAGNRWFDQDNTYLDFFPGPNGQEGQLAVFGKGVFGEFHGPGFGESMELFASGLERGDWIIRDGFCVPKSKRTGSWSKHVRKKLG